MSRRKNRIGVAGLAIVLGAIFAGGSVGGNADQGTERLLEAGHWKRLRRIAEARSAANPNDAAAAFYLGRAKEQAGDLQGAMPLAEKAVSLEPNNARFHLLVAQVAIDMAQKAGMFKGLGLAHRFRNEAQKAAELGPKDVDVRESLMEFYFAAPGIAGGDKKKAWEMAEEIGRIDAVRGLLAKATLAGKEKNAAKQEGFHQKALAAAPHDARVLREAAAFYSSDGQKKYELAEKYATDALKLEEDQIAPYVVLSVVYAATERWKELDEIVAKVEKAIPDDFGAHYQAAKVLVLTGKDLPRSERYFRKYLTMEPEIGEPPHAAAHWRLGQVLEKQGKKQEAIAEMEESLRLQPDFKQAKEDLKRLRR